MGQDKETIGDSFTVVDPKEFMQKVRADLDEAVGMTLVDPDVEEDKPHVPVVHNPLVMVMPSKPMTVLETDICEMHSLGKSTAYIANFLGILPHTVRNTLAKPHIRDFVYELVNAQYTSKLEGRLRIINSIIEAKLEKIEEMADGDMSQVTKKDVVDLMVITDNMMKEKQKKELGADSNVYLQIINAVTKEG